MKKLILITIMILSSFVYARICDSWPYRGVTSNITPIKSGEYYAITKDFYYSNGELIKIGKSFMYSNWENDFWYNTHWISCKITNIEPKSDSDNFQDEGCLLLTLDCSVEERTQFYTNDVKYTDLKGYRKNGTLQWSRDKVGSTDIYCYNKSGLSVVSRVNDPQYCK